MSTMYFINVSKDTNHIVILGKGYWCDMKTSIGSVVVDKAWGVLCKCLGYPIRNQVQLRFATYSRLKTPKIPTLSLDW